VIDAALMGARLPPRQPAEDPVTHVLIASADLPFQRRLLAWLGEARGPENVAQARSRRHLLDQVAGRPAGVVLTDFGWMGGSPAQLVAQLRAACPAAHLLLACDEPGPADLLAALDVGARGLVDRAAPRKTWIRAVSGVERGQPWLPRDLLVEVLSSLFQQLFPRGYAAGVRFEALTPRQRDIARCVACGMSNKQIGRALRISPATVKTHMHNIFDRLGVSGRLLLSPHAAVRGDDAPVAPGAVAQPDQLADWASIQLSTRVSNTDNGTEPVPSTTSWNARRSKCSPSRDAARSRSSDIFNWPIL
jgi:DNA-binding NarL/FixJ family response regulator